MLSPGTATMPGADLSPVSSRHRPDEAFEYGQGSTGVDGDIEKRVMEMAGLGLGISPAGESSAAGRRILSEAPRRAGAGLSPPEGMTRSQSADTRLGGSVDASASSRNDMDPRWDMAMLRRIVEKPGNSQCADCGKNMKSSRWAAISALHVLMHVVGQLTRLLRFARGAPCHIPLHPLLRPTSCFRHAYLQAALGRPRHVDAADYQARERVGQSTRK